MSEPQQPPVPPSAQPNPAFPPAPPAPHLPAAPQYPAGAPQQPAAPEPPQAPQYRAPQQQAPQQQYQTAPQPPYGQQAAYGQQRPSAPRSGNPLARTAFIIALVVAAVGALQILLQPFVLASFSYDAGNFGVFTTLFGVIVFLGSAAALVLGLIAVRRSGGQVLAGIAIGVGGVQLISVVLAWISSLFYYFF
ncbi:hypothetical protein [Microbacterium sp. K24]|uniref:hypothetical protein n=1 Tax=Microbacterium sp. K24 TaxID=2305446 RepID=UPI00109C7FCA|nr:hypothetical protein [Microbacterium sp. K24]